MEKVYTDSVWVHWQCKALMEDNNIQTTSLQQPHPRVTGEQLKQLKRLNLFDACMLQIYDRSYLKYVEGDTLIHINDWYREQSKKFELIYKQQNKNKNILSPSKLSFIGNINSSSTSTNLAAASTTSGNNMKSASGVSNIDDKVNKRKKKSNQSLETENNLHNKMLRVKIKIKEKSSAMFNGGRGGSSGVAGNASSNLKKSKKMVREQNENNDQLDPVNNSNTSEVAVANGEDEWVSEDEEAEETIGCDVDAVNFPSRSPSTSTNFAKTTRKINDQFIHFRNLLKSFGGGTSKNINNVCKISNPECCSVCKKPQTHETIEEKSKSTEDTKSSVFSHSKARRSSFNYYSSLADFGRKFRNNPLFRKKLKVLTRPSIKINDEFVTEALLVRSKATIVWQDGSIETDVPSTELYPITHLDGHVSLYIFNIKLNIECNQNIIYGFIYQFYKYKDTLNAI